LPSCKKAIVIGESTERIKKAVKDLRAKGIDATWYRAWKKNFAEEIYDETQSVARNKRWIRDKAKKGFEVFDVGIDRRRPERSIFYKAEKKMLDALKYPTTFLQGY
jgi:hypothetical protein